MQPMWQLGLFFIGEYLRSRCMVASLQCIKFSGCICYRSHQKLFVCATQSNNFKMQVCSQHFIEFSKNIRYTVAIDNLAVGASF